MSQQLIPLISKNDAAGLALLKELAEAGKIRVIVDRQSSLRDTPQAITHVRAGHARGRVVINVD